MVEIEETNKRDRANTSFESVKDDDQKSPQHKKRKKVKMRNKDYTMIY